MKKTSKKSSVATKARSERLTGVVTIRLESEAIAAIDELAKIQGVDRSSVLRRHIKTLQGQRADDGASDAPFAPKNSDTEIGSTASVIEGIYRGIEYSCTVLDSIEQLLEKKAEGGEVDLVQMRAIFSRAAVMVSEKLP